MIQARDCGGGGSGEKWLLSRESQQDSLLDQFWDGSEKRVKDNPKIC